MGTVGDVVVDQRIREIQREYLEFLEETEDVDKDVHPVRDMIARNEHRLIVNINDLRKKNHQRAHGILNSAFDELPAFERALKEFVAAIDTSYAKGHEAVFIGLEGSFGSKHLSPRTLAAKNLGSLICIEGIITKCSLIRPKLVRSVHFCPATQKTLERCYTDMSSYDAFPSSGLDPTKDDDGNLLETKYGLCTYKDHQTVSIQEMPERATAGQLPRSIDVILENDLVDLCKPGDRVQVVGVYHCLPSKKNGFTSGTFRTILIANNVISMSKEASLCISKEDVMNCKKFSRTKEHEVFGLLAKSLAPSIHGHEYIKKALLCMLLGGVEKILPNGTRLSGDINILLIGDPSVAKSQLLRYVIHAAPRAISTTGRGSSGVGLTAAVTMDPETGDRRLEAGAMVLADRGIVCIDEFDEMSDIDRTAINEVMEQGHVTLSKDGIHARLDARCSVLAAANPVYGHYDKYKTPMENIGLQDSLLSCFDCLFIMLDIVDSESDRMISDHVVRMHQYSAPHEQDGDILSTQNPDENEEADESPIFEKYNATLHGTMKSKKDKYVSINFMKKYIFLAKNTKPALTKEASEVIAEEYSRLRSLDTEHTRMARTQPVTARALETLIRLSTAHAKARLSKTVNMEDAKAAIEMVKYAYFKKQFPFLGQFLEKKEQLLEKKESEDTETEDEERVCYFTARKRIRRHLESIDKMMAEGLPWSRLPANFTDDFDDTTDEFDNDDMDTDDMDTESSSSRSCQRKTSQEEETPRTLEISTERLEAFKSTLNKVLKQKRAQSMEMAKLTTLVNKEAGDDSFSREEVDAAIQRMSDDNYVMVSDDILFLI